MDSAGDTNITYSDRKMSDSRNINLVIADRPYRIKISTDEEKTVRKATQLIKQKLTDLKKSYQAKDKQDYLAMAALMFCVDSINSDNNLNEDFSEKLDELDGLLNVFLEK